MPILQTTVINNPCANCPVCARGLNDGNGTILHIGNFLTDGNGNPHPQAAQVGFPHRPEWNVNGNWNTTTRKNHPVTIRVVTTDDIQSLTNTPEVFPEHNPEEPDFTPNIIREFAYRRALYYPYICIALVGQQIVARLFLDPNPQNAVRKDLNAAIIDNGVTHPDFESRGYMDKLVEFAETTARNNGVRWVEIGCMREAPNTAASHARRATDSLRLLALPRGYHHHASILHNPIIIHYNGRNLPGNAVTMEARRYGKALVLYKDLESDFVYSQAQRNQIFDELVEQIPD